MQAITVCFKEIEDRFLVPFYLQLQKNRLTKGKFLGDYIDLFTGKRAPQSAFVDENYPSAIKYFNVQDVKIPFLNNSYISWINPSAVKINYLEEGDLVISRVGTAGKVSIVTSTENRSAFTDNAIIIRIKDNNFINPLLCVLLLNSKFGYRQIKSAKKGTLQEVINYDTVRRVLIPEMTEKNKKYLSDLMHLVIEKHIKAINNIFKAEQILYEAININHNIISEEKTYIVNSANLMDVFTPKFYYPKYLNTLKALKKKFKTIKLGEIADIKRGDEVGSENYRKYIDRRDSDIPFIRTSDLVNYEIDNYPDYYIDEEIYKELKQDLREGDIIYTKDGKIGLSAILTAEDKCILASGLARIRIKKDLDPHYVFLVLSTNIGYYQAMQRVVIAATLPHLQQERLGEIEIPIINDQTKDKISQLVAEAFKLKAEKKKLFREALTMVEELLK